jgi:glycerate kinase
MAAASGLGLVAEDERDAWAASTYGTGQLIAGRAEAGAQVILVAVGGSATTDGGAGALEAIADAAACAARRSSCSPTCARSSRTPRRSSARRRAPTPTWSCKLRERLEQLAATFPRDPRGVPMTGAAGA